MCSRIEVQYNFESPYVANRVQELGHALQCLANDPETGQRPWNVCECDLTQASVGHPDNQRGLGKTWKDLERLKEV